MTYYSLTEDLCRIFIDTCPLCLSMSQGVEVKPNTVVTQSRFRERMTACTINYSTTPIEGIDGVKLRYILVLQDEATKFTILRPIGSVDANVLENELKLMFMTIGYPKKVFVCDEESNFASVSIKRMIEQEEPNCEQEYGVVDEIVHRVKNVIAELEVKKGEEAEGEERQMRWMERRESNWASVLPVAMKIINETAYPKVYGTQFSSSELRKGGAVARASGATEEQGLTKKRKMDDKTAAEQDLYPQLLCQECDRLTANGRRLVTVMKEESEYDSFAVGRRWWTADLIRTFGLLKSHEAHREDMIFVDAGTPTKRECRIPGDARSLKLPDTVKHLLTVAVKNGHFVVIQVKLEHCTTVVYDGRISATNGNEDLEQWMEHEEYVMSRYGISKENSNLKWHIRYQQETKDFRRIMRIRQDDNHSCGPNCVQGLMGIAGTW